MRVWQVPVPLWVPVVGQVATVHTGYGEPPFLARSTSLALGTPGSGLAERGGTCRLGL